VGGHWAQASDGGIGSSGDVGGGLDGVVTNRLAGESSPYLQQHAENPVDWHPWGPEALSAATDQDKPILLSVGYSACHWCHVMAHESFENPDIAAKMNESYINVKVDREERPDIDALYMEAVQAMTGHGGWPMTVVMTPDGEPFFTGTYFPPTSRQGMPGFGQLLDAIAVAWATDRDALVSQASAVTNELRSRALLAPVAGLPDHRLLAQACQSLIQDHDPINGGFGAAPKFPSPMALDVLFRHYTTTGDVAALQVAELTLDHMAAGGMYDHLGGGFARYSVDAEWAVPHFEKMLSDNALLVVAYVHGWQLTGSSRHLQVVQETVGYVLRDLRLEGGAFATAEDADSEGAEGTFYVWAEAQMRDVLDDTEWAAARDWYGVTAEGNFEGANVLHRPSVGMLLRPDLVEAARAKLQASRGERERPGLDDKVLTEWNALMISALAEAGAAAGVDEWVDAAADAMEFLEEVLFADGRWYRSWQQTGGRHHLAYAADYAALVDAYTRLGEATGQRRWHLSALSTAEAMLDLFWDDETGGVFTTGRDAEQLLVRRKELFDSPVPSANANAAAVLLRLAAIHGRSDLSERAEQILRLVGADMALQPLAHSRLLAAFDLAVGSMSEIVIAGDRPDLLAEVRRHYLPNTVVVHGESFDSPLWQDRSGDQAYICKGYTCGLPTDDPVLLATQLEALGPPVP
jgi:uncharacterized protein YyaL (SSP411 family)